MKESPSVRWQLAMIILLTAVLACNLSTGAGGLHDYGPAAEIQGDYWFHVNRPLTLQSLQGKVVLLGVWKFT
jgi:hypothetical protein